MSSEPSEGAQNARREFDSIFRERLSQYTGKVARAAVSHFMRRNEQDRQTLYDKIQSGDEVEVIPEEVTDLWMLTESALLIDVSVYDVIKKGYTPLEVGTGILSPGARPVCAIRHRD